MPDDGTPMTDAGPVGERGLALRIIDCTTGMAGPLAAMYLADFGAEVIKVEPPGGEPGRADAGFPYWNRNKQGIVLDTQTEPGRMQLEALLAGADGCMFSAPTGELRPFGLDPESVTVRHPGIVYLHAPPYVPEGFGSDLPESLGLLSALTGVAQYQYSNERVPIDPVVPHVLSIQGIWGAASMLAAFYERLRSARGQAVTVGGLQGVLTAAGGFFTQLAGVDPGRPLGGPGGKMPNYRLYRCSDGEWFFLGAFTPAFRVAAFQTLGLLEPFLSDPRIDGELAAVGLPGNLGWAGDRVAEVVRTRPRAEWLEKLRDAGVPCEPVLTREEWLRHPQLETTGALVSLVDPERGPVSMPGVPLRLSDWPAPSFRPAPRLGEHEGMVAPRAVAAGPAAEHAAVAEARGPLDGVRVLDLGAIIAGPYIGNLLADLGADVIKVEPTSGDNLRGSGITFAGYNLGKRSLAIDLQRPEAHRTFLELVKRADLVLDNFRPGVLKRLGIDYEALRAVNPRIITASITGFGAEGPLGGRPGFDPLLQALSGMMDAQGGDGAPVFYTIPVHDVGSAATAALGAILALLRRSASRQGQQVETSLAAVSVTLQPGECVQFAGRPPSIRGGTDFPGPSALDRHYRTQDGWLRIQVRADAAGAGARLRSAGLIGPTTSDAELADVLADALAGRSTADALHLLNANHVRAVVTRNVGDLPEAAEVVDAKALALAVSPVGQAIWAAGNTALFSRSARQGAKLPPGLGEHSLEVLREAGVDEADIDELVRSKAVLVGSPFVVPE